MKIQHLIAIFITFLLALAVNTAVQNYRSTMITVVVNKSVGLNGPEIDISQPLLPFFNGGTDSQIYVFTNETDSNGKWQLDYVLSNSMGMGGDVADTYYLLVCAPKSLSGEEALSYMWNRYHSQNWHVDWKGFEDLPGKVNIYCQ